MEKLNYYAVARSMYGLLRNKHISYRGHLLVEARRKARHQVSNFCSASQSTQIERHGGLKMTLTAKRVGIGDEKMRELKLSSPLNIQIITEPERMALRIALDKSIGENLGMVLALKDTKREIPQGLYNSGLDYHRDNLEIYLRLRNRLEDAIYEAESNGKQRDKKA